jgi:hypothetical protein
MSIEIKENEAPSLAKCEMLCDGGLHDKLNKYDLTKFMNEHSTNLLIGKPKSGKTSLLYSLFKSPQLFKKVYHNIYLFQPSASRASMKDKLFDKLPDENKFDELTLENLTYVVDTIKNEDKDYNNCIIFDDMGAYLKNPETKKLLKEIIMNRRHLRCSIYFLVQTWFSIEKDVRKLFSNIFVFRVSKKELETIFDEVVEQKKCYVGDIAKIVYDEPYKYLFINTDSQRLFKCFDELIIKD